MDSDPHLSKNTRSSEIASSSKFIEGVEQQQIPEEEDPYSLNGTYISLIGLAIAICSMVIPFVAVLTERPPLQRKIRPTSIEIDGFKSSNPFSDTGFSKSSS
tara:strand:+ start:575 stop:880 length:306 start_codon:yes stop_codon:yes gene_type:complete